MPCASFFSFRKRPLSKEVGQPLVGRGCEGVVKKCGSEMQCIGDGRRGCLGVGKSIFPGVVERMVTRFGLTRCPSRLSAASSHPSVASWRQAGVRRHGGTGGKPSKSGGEHISYIRRYYHYVDRTIFRFFHELVVWLAGWLAWLAGWLVVVRARARA